MHANRPPLQQLNLNRGMPKVELSVRNKKQKGGNVLSE
jgi:hypothetical protein